MLSRRTLWRRIAGDRTLCEPQRSNGPCCSWSSTYPEPVTLSQLADIAGLTIFQLNTAFRREVGMPPYRYLSRLRINAAMELLRKGMPTAMVAAEAGFFDQPHMYRRFTRRFGLTPGQLVAGDTCDALTVESGTGHRSSAVPG